MGLFRQYRQLTQRYIVCESDGFIWVVVPQDVIVTVRTSLTPNLVSVVVYPIPRSESLIWAAKRLELMNSPFVSTLCLMNLNNFLLKPLKLHVFVVTSTWLSTQPRINSTLESVSTLTMF